MFFNAKLNQKTLYIIGSLIVSALVGGFQIGREWLKDDLAKEKIELTWKNTRLQDTINRKENRIKQLLAECDRNTKDCEKRFAEERSRVPAQKTEREYEVNKDRRSISEVGKRSSLQPKVWGQTRIKQWQEGENKNTVPLPAAHVDTFIFQAIKCIRQGSAMYLEIRITNTSTSAEELILVASRQSSYYKDYPTVSTCLTDARGLTYPARNVEFGGQSRSDQAEQTIHPRLSLMARFWFEGVDTDSRRVSVRIGAIHARWVLPNAFFVPLQGIPVEPSS